jgi:hypothetical protein
LNPSFSRAVKSLSPIQSLVFLSLFGLAIAGWFYGLHWKRIAAGDLFSSDEKLMVRLQDQISALSEENDSLHKRLRDLEGTEASEAKQDPTGVAESGVVAPFEPIVLPSSGGPSLPAPPQKIETH